MQRKRRIAASRVYTSPETYLTNTVVELTDGIVTDTHPLQGEPAMTEWLCGTIVLTSQPDTHKEIRNIDDFYTQTSAETIAYLIECIPSQENPFNRDTPITRLK